LEKRLLGRTGIQVSEISFGAAPIGIPYGIDAQQQLPKEDESIRLLQKAVNRGMNFFDTARSYGRSEYVIGKAFKGSREKVVICTKCKNFPYDDGSLPGGKEMESFINDSLQKSLSELQTDYVDIFMIHSATERLLENQDVTEIFSNYKNKGIAKAIGVSTYTVEETRKAIESGVWDVIQLPFNLLDQSQSELFSLAEQNGVGIVVRSVLFKGILTDRSRNLHPKLKFVTEHCQKYNSLLNEQVPRLSDLAVKFVLSCKEVSSVLVGIDRFEYLESCFAVANGKYLGEKTLAAAKQLAYPEPELLDLTEWHKAGWLI
jgi:aryl-alcohol dehydrogenase-like predicted oxidoreductase